MITSHHFTDGDGVPNGGQTFGRGFAIAWQNGPLVHDGQRNEPNGAFVEDIILAAIDRLEFHQRGKFASGYNANAIAFLESAIAELNARTADRKSRGVEGTTNV